MERKTVKSKSELKHVADAIDKMRSMMKKLSLEATNDRKPQPIVYFDISINSVPQDRVRFKLYSDETPITCENFRQLCTGDKGFGFKGNSFHRIVKNFVVQGGDITSSNGTGGRSIYAGTPHGDMWGNFKDEKFLPHSKKGLLSMANKGPNTNTSQFFVTLRPCPSLDNKHVVFGEVIEGFATVLAMEQCVVDKTAPQSDAVVIVACGEEVPVTYASVSKKIDVLFGEAAPEAKAVPVSAEVASVTSDVQLILAELKPSSQTGNNKDVVFGGVSTFGSTTATSTSAIQTTSSAQISVSATLQTSTATSGSGFGFGFTAPAATSVAPTPGGFSFGFGSSAPETTAPAVSSVSGGAGSTGGFTFGTTVPVKAAVAAEEVSSSRSTGSSDVPSDSAVLLTAAKYVAELGLDEDEQEEVQSEIENAKQAWTQVLGRESATISSSSSKESNEALFDRLMTKLGTTYSEEEHGSELSGLVSASGFLSVYSFSNWYVRWLYHSDASDAGGDSDEERETAAEARSSSSSGSSSSGWSNVKWAVAPGGEPSGGSGGDASKGGSSWKCSACSVMNAADKSGCACCGTANPIAAPVVPAAVSTSGGISSGGFSFGGAPLATPAVAAATSGSGFGFGFTAPAATSVAPTPGGFSFGVGSSAPETTAPAVSSVSGGAGSTGGFTFGTTTVPAVTAVVATEAVSSSSSTSSSDVPSDSAVLLTAAKYVSELGLDEDEQEEVQSEIENAKQAWTQVLGRESATISSSSRKESNEALFDRLMTKLGTTYSEEEHGSELSGLVAASGFLSVYSFSNWYVRWLYHSDASDAGGDSDEERETAAEACSSSSSGSSSSGWSNVKWAVAPGGESSGGSGGDASKGGSSWKCSACSVMNAADKSGCACCGTANPNAAPVVPAAVSTSGGISSGGFSFGGAPLATPAVAAATSGSGFGFGFTAPAANSVAPTPGGFSFGFGSSASTSFASSSSSSSVESLTEKKWADESLVQVVSQQSSVTTSVSKVTTHTTHTSHHVTLHSSSSSSNSDGNNTSSSSNSH